MVAPRENIVFVKNGRFPRHFRGECLMEKEALLERTPVEVICLRRLRFRPGLTLIYTLSRRPESNRMRLHAGCTLINSNQIGTQTTQIELAIIGAEWESPRVYTENRTHIGICKFNCTHWRYAETSQGMIVPMRCIGGG